jgi:hypothetical protein
MRKWLLHSQAIKAKTIFCGEIKHKEMLRLELQNVSRSLRLFSHSIAMLNDVGYQKTRSTAASQPARVCV